MTASLQKGIEHYWRRITLAGYIQGKICARDLYRHAIGFLCWLRSFGATKLQPRRGAMDFSEHQNDASECSASLITRVQQGKGAKDRYGPLPRQTLEGLRQSWKTYGHPVWLFPAPRRSGPG